MTTRITRPVEVPTLDAIAARPDCVRDLPRHALLDLALRCAVVQGAVLAAMTAAAPNATTQPEPDRLLSAVEAAQILGQRREWVYRHADILPFTVREPGRRPRFSLKGIQAYISRQVAVQAAGKGA